MLRKDSGRRDADRQDGRLRVLSKTQILLRTLETKPRKRKAERGIGLGEGLRSYGKSFGQFAAHANSLRTLPGKEKGNFCGHF